MAPKTKSIDRRLSYSSGNLLLNCEQRYWHHKVGNTPHDADHEDNVESLNVGKAFHAVLEDTMHTETKETHKLVISYCKEYEVPGKILMVHAMVRRYLAMHAMSGLKCILCETPLSYNHPTHKTDVFTGYIDAILVDPYTKVWWVTDLKTAARWDEKKVALLPQDPQLNLYSHFAVMMASVMDLDPAKFGGIRYRVTTKATIKQSAREGDADYYQRLFDRIQSLDVVIPKHLMDSQGVWDRHMELWHKAEDLRAGVAPQRNYQNCMNYMRPCPWFSQCHGELFTKSGERVKVETEETYKNKPLIDFL